MSLPVIVFRAVAAGAILFLTTCWAIVPSAEADVDQSVWVFGDSLSSSGRGWAGLIATHGYAHMRNTARGGLRMTDVTIPDWLRCVGPNNDQVIIWLGTNDALQGIYMPHFKTKLRDHLQVLEGRGCRVYLVLPPLFVQNHEAAAKIEPYRDVTLDIGLQYTNVTIIEPVWNEDLLFDGLHQEPALHFWQAVDFINKLGLTLPEEAEQ